MRIFFLSNAASTHTVKWVNALSDIGHEVHLIFKYDDNPIIDTISTKVIQHRLKHSGTKAYFMSAFEVHQLYREIKPDLVNAHYASGYGTLARLAKVHQLVLSVWGSDVYEFPYQNSFKMRLIKKNLWYADEITSTSHCMADQVKKILGIDSTHINVIPFGVDLKNFIVKNVKYDNNHIVIGNIKTLSPVYGIDILILAIHKLKDNLCEKGFAEIANKIRVHIYGSGEQKDELLVLVQKLKLENVVEFKGYIPNSDVPKALEQLDIFCATSKRESFGVALVEAMAMELPIVATKTEGFMEVVDNYVTGFLVEIDDTNEIAISLEKLVLDKELRIKMGLVGRERALKKFNWFENVNSMNEVYKKVMEKNKD